MALLVLGPFGPSDSHVLATLGPSSGRALCPRALGPVATLRVATLPRALASALILQLTVLGPNFKQLYDNKPPQAVFLQLLCIGLVRPQSNFLQVSFSADKDEVEAGEAVTFIVTARRTPGHPSTLQNNEVRSCFMYRYFLLTLERKMAASLV